MSKALDPRIADILSKYGEDPSDTKTVLWDCHGTWVVYHAAVERIAARAGVQFDLPQILRAERDEAVILVSASLGERKDWDIGECLVGVNYKVSPRQAAFCWAMAAKRARDRVVLKLVGLHGLLYSEEEADSFKAGHPPSAADDDASDAVPITVNGSRVSAYRARKDNRWEPLVTSLRSCPTVEALEKWTDDHTADFEELPAGWVEELRSEYKARVYEIKTGR